MARPPKNLASRRQGLSHSPKEPYRITEKAPGAINGQELNGEGGDMPSLAKTDRATAGDQH